MRIELVVEVGIQFAARRAALLTVKLVSGGVQVQEFAGFDPTDPTSTPLR